METIRRAPALAVLFLLAACGTPGTALDMTPPDVTPNNAASDAGSLAVVDAGPLLVPDAGAILPCPVSYLSDGGGGCIGPYTLQLLSSGSAQFGDSIFVGNGEQPLFTVREVDPALAALNVPVLLTLSAPGFPSAAYPITTTRWVPVDTSAWPENAYQAQAQMSLDGGTLVSNVLTVVVDRTPPQVSLSLPGVALDGGALLRDFIAEAVVTATDDASGIADLRLFGTGPTLSRDGGIVAQGSATVEWSVALSGTDTHATVGTAEVHAADIPFDTGADQAADVALTATAIDNAGNSGQAVLHVPLTRLKWTSTLVPGSRDGMVLGPTGRIYGALAFDMWGLDPSGTSAWTVSPGSDATTQGGPLVRGGSEVVDFTVVDWSSGTATSHIAEVCGADGTANCGVTTFQSITGAVFTSSPTYSAATRRMVVADEAQCAVFTFNGAGGSQIGDSMATKVAPNCTGVEIGVNGAETAVATLQGDVLYDYSEASEGPQDSVASDGWLISGVAISGSAAWFAAGSQLVGYDTSTSPVSSIATYDAGAALSAPVIDSAGHLYVAADDGTLSQLGNDGKPLWRLQLAGQSMPGVPAVGADGTIYVVDSAGALDAVDSTGYLRWTTGALFAAGYRSPMIDPCNHTLYVTTAIESGVHAVVVDSAGLDLTGKAWPVYRRDYFGTGDAQAGVAIDCSGHP